MLSEIGLSEWMDPAGATLPEGWCAELKTAIHRLDQCKTMADLFSSSQHLVLYRQVIHGSGEFFRWKKQVARYGISDEQLIWWCKLRSGQLEGFGLNAHIVDGGQGLCRACGLVVETPQHFLLGMGCVVTAPRVDMWQSRRQHVASLFGRRLLSLVGVDVHQVYCRVPLLADRLLISLGRQWTVVGDHRLWPARAAGIVLWQQFWQQCL